MESDLYLKKYPRSPETNYLGYFKYEGKLVDGGFLAATKSAQALLGMDKALRYFIISQEPGLRDIDFDLPVKVRAGSWEALLPDTIGVWLRTGIGAAFTSYMVTASKKLAENDIGERGLVDIMRNAFKGVQWFIRIAKHVGNLQQDYLDGVRVDSENLLIGVQNEEGEMLWIPKFHFDLLQGAPADLLSDVVSVVEEQRELIVGVADEDGLAEVRAGYRERGIFVEEEEEEFLFPELEHGKEVELEGKVTRGNGETNTIGFKYRGHILNCIPESGSIVRFKPVLFSDARIVGTVTRQKEEEDTWALRPKVIFSDLIPIGEESRQLDLF